MFPHTVSITIVFAIFAAFIPNVATASCISDFNVGASNFYKAQDAYNKGVKLSNGSTITCDQKYRITDLASSAAKLAARSHIAFYNATWICTGGNRSKAERAYNLKLKAYKLEDVVNGQCK